MPASFDCNLSISTLLFFNESSADGDNESLSGSSLVSEVTMMTYSKERANMIKEEFFVRIRQETKSLTLQEKKALLEEIQDEQDEKFRRQIKIEKEKRKEEERQKMMANEQKEAQAAVFENLYQLRLQKQEENEQHAAEEAQHVRAAPTQLRRGRCLVQSFSTKPSLRKNDTRLARSFSMMTQPKLENPNRNNSRSTAMEGFPYFAHFVLSVL